MYSNCSGNHPTHSQNCSTYKQEKEIIEVKCKKNISFPEAWKGVIMTLLPLEFVQSSCSVFAIGIDHFNPSPALSHVVFDLDHKAGEDCQQESLN